MTNLYTKNENGFALLLAMIVASVVLSIGLSLLSTSIKQLDLGSTVRGSEEAFQVATAGMECARHIRNKQENDFLSQSAVQIDCFGDGSTMSATNHGAVVAEYKSTIDYQNKCIDIEMWTFDARSESSPITINVNRDINANDCAVGDFCTIALVRGYNKACTDINTGIFSVQRELTSEF